MDMWGGESPNAHGADDGHGQLYRLAAPELREAGGLGSGAAWGPLPLSSPWRVVLAGTLATVVASTGVTDVSRPLHPFFARVWPSWVRPGRATWDWVRRCPIAGVSCVRFRCV